MAYDNTNTGVLFKNEKKSSEKSPDFTGKVDINGKEYRLAGWFKFGSKSGTKFISLKASEPDEKYERKQQASDGEDSFRKAGASDW